MKKMKRIMTRKILYTILEWTMMMMACTLDGLGTSTSLQLRAIKGIDWVHGCFQAAPTIEFLFRRTARIDLVEDLE
jgi:hypothetical protein